MVIMRFMLYMHFKTMFVLTIQGKDSYLTVLILYQRYILSELDALIVV